jgi:Ribbon-helix-helix protein, copG family
MERLTGRRHSRPPWCVVTRLGGFGALRDTLRHVRKTSVYLSESEAARLAALARQEGISQADVIRRAIRQYLPEQRGTRRFALSNSADGPGGSIADIPDDELLDGFGS